MPLGITLGIVVSKIIDKAWPVTKLEGLEYLKSIAETCAKMLGLQQLMQVDLNVDRERLMSAVRSVERMDERFNLRLERLEERLTCHVMAQSNANQEIISRLSGGNGAT